MTGERPRGSAEFEAFEPGAVRWGRDGLVPGIVQDAFDRRVLMLGYLDAEALAATLDTRDVHFHSRSRGRLWRKGETSGNVLRLRAIAFDCDADALLLTVDPVGPTCHRGTGSCFDPDGASGERTSQGFAWLETLWATIDERARLRPQGSYTARLLAGGVDSVGRKVTEESTEVLLAAKDDAVADASGAERAATKRRVAEETGDLLYHALVLLAERGIPPRDVLAVLEERRSR